MLIQIPENCSYASYEEFEAAKRACSACEMGKIYGKVVCSEGCRVDPKVLVTGEAPGADEIEQGRPFIGKAGKLLRSVLNEFGFRQYNTIITNVMPCRPPDNKFPQDYEKVCFCASKWIVEEITLLRPEFILLLGTQPLKYLAGDIGITTKRGSWYDVGTAHAMATYHPSFVLRKRHMEDGSEIERNFREDIKAVALAAGLIDKEGALK